MKNKDKENNNIENLTYDILGNAFVGNLFNMSSDGDNSSQNLATYLEVDNIKKLRHKYKQNVNKK